MKIKLLLQYVIFWLIIFLICFTSSTFIFSLLELLLKLDNYSFSDFKKMASFWLNGIFLVKWLCCNGDFSFDH